jgi:hypothetical protein
LKFDFVQSSHAKQFMRGLMVWFVFH